MRINRHRAAGIWFPAALAGVLMLLSSAAAQPTLIQPQRNVSPGEQVNLAIADVFDNAGANPRFTGATFSNPEYLNSSEVTADSISFELKTGDELNGLSPRPRSHFRFTVQVSMDNDDGWGTTGTLTYLASYARAPDTTGGIPGPVNEPVLAQTLDLDAPVGERVEVAAGDVFAYAGTNPRFTAATFSTMAYYNSAGIENGVLAVEAMTAADLSALASPPDAVFRVTADVTMTNDEGQTATGTLTFVTVFVVEKPDGEDREDLPPGVGAGAQPVQPEN